MLNADYVRGLDRIGVAIDAKGTRDYYNSLTQGEYLTLKISGFKCQAA
jgi:hypothetical protein